MKMYNDTVMEHFMNPHNVGEIENADGEGIYGSPVCGDMMKMTIEHQKEQIDAIYQSTSWKITRPIRWVLDRIRGQEHRG